jgi:hypothetical protein
VRTVYRLGLLTLVTLAMADCSSQGASSPQDGATDSEAGGSLDGRGDDGATNAPIGVDAAALDAEHLDEPQDTSTGALDVGPAYDGPDTALDVALTSDGTVGADLVPVDTGQGESGAAACGAVGSACAVPTACSSGDDVDLGCRSILVCQNGTLSMQNSLFIRCGASSGSPCPATRPEDGTSCPLHAQVCSYSTGTCACATGCESPVDAGPCQQAKTWHCSPATATGCPRQAPHLGTPCLQESITCSYGSPCLQFEFRCHGGFWEPWNSTPFGGCA